MSQEKTSISAGLGTSLTAHLQPVIDFIKAHGNTPATGDSFYFDRDGFGTYGFMEPIDTALLLEHFDFPSTIKVSNEVV